MTTVYLVAAFLVALRAGAGQVKTNVPDPVPGARPATVERITDSRARRSKAISRAMPSTATAIVFLPPGYHQNRTRPLSGRLRATRLLDWRGPVVAGDPRAADDRGRLCQRRARDDRRPAGFEDGTQRLDVLELGDDRRFRKLRRARRRGLHRWALSDDRQPREPRPGRPLHGRLWSHAHRHEARRRVRQPLHHEPVLPVGARQRRRSRRSGR